MLWGPSLCLGLGSPLAQGSGFEMSPNSTKLLLALLVGHLQAAGRGGAGAVSDTPKGTSMYPLGTFALLQGSGLHRDGMEKEKKVLSPLCSCASPGRV